ncbi:uncharacterized protein BX664DRAFT_235567, partial [Halteromyces radiatus]|uniref:uncharacterized protein n=1 Tax=Halteromyces radiatus TaxID=101107 RepID=UPI00221EE6E2
KTYPQAWIALFILTLLRIATAVFQFTYSAVPNLTSQTFQVSLTAINWLANVQGLVYVIMSFFTGWIYEKLGVKRSVSFKYKKKRFRQLMLSIFFLKKKKVLIAGFFCTLGAVILGATAACALLALLFMPVKPPHPPSHVSRQPRPSFYQGLKLLSKNYPFWIIFLIQGINVGISIAFGTIFTQIISPYGYTDTQAGQINAIAFFTGTIGCAIAGCVLDATKQHKLFLKATPPLVFFSNLGFYLLSNEKGFIHDGFIFDCIQPVSAYPVSEATSSSFLWQGGQIFGFIILAVMDALRDPKGEPINNMQRALLLLTILTALMGALAFLFKGRMCRSEAIA